MDITTIQQVNDIGCCCPFPECPGNRWKHNDKTLELQKNGWAPIIKPAGEDDTQDIPTLYEFNASDEFWVSSGCATWYEGWNENPTIPGEYGELRQRLDVTYDPDTFIRSSVRVNTSNVSEAGPPFADATPGSATWTYTGSEAYNIQFTHQFSTLWDWAYEVEEADASEVVLPEHYEVGDNFWRKYDDAIRYWTTEEPMELQGAGGSQGLSSYSFDITEHHIGVISLTGDFTKQSRIEDLVMALESEGIAYGATDLTTIPKAATAMDFYRYSELTTGERWPIVDDAETWAGPPNYGLTSRFSLTAANHARFRITCDGLQNRYKVGIPEEWENANAAWASWLSAHEAWLEADPETRGDEPVEPKGKRSVFECQWEEGFFPQAWLEWEEAHGVWQTNHAAWQGDWNEWNEADPETRGDEPVEPEEPAKPTDPEDRPSKLLDREWTYGGPLASPFSDFYIMPAPDALGEVRPVNMLIKCYHATKVGVKPTSHGEVIDWTNP